MDDFIDLFDLFDFGRASDLIDLADVTDFADIAAFADIIDGIDFLPLDATDVAAVVDFDPSDLTNFEFDSDALIQPVETVSFESLDFGAVDLAALPPELTGTGLDTAFLEALHSPDSASALSNYVSSTLEEYPNMFSAGSITSM